MALPRGTVSGKVTKTVLAYVEHAASRPVAEELAAAVAREHRIEARHLFEAESVLPMDVAEALYPHVTKALGDPRAIENAGLFSGRITAVGVFTFGMVKLLGGIKVVYQKVGDINPRFANTGTLRCTKAASNDAVVEFEMYPELSCTKLGCDYRKGVFRSVPLTFGKSAPARLVHTVCQADGKAKEVYELSWE